MLVDVRTMSCTRSVRENPTTKSSSLSRKRSNKQVGTKQQYNSSKLSEPQSDLFNDSRVERQVEDSSTDSDYMSPVLMTKKRRVKRDPSIAGSDVSKETLPVSPDSNSALSEGEKSDADDDSSNSSRSDAESLEAFPDGQWEIEEILNYVKDDYGELYHVKWKDWASEFNTWEPPGNLLNCDDELLRFYRKRQEDLQEAIDSSEYIEQPNGKRRRKGPSLPDVPPDPRPFDLRVQEFFDVTGCTLDDEEVLKVFIQWKSKKPNSKSRWSVAKINKYLQDGVSGKLANSDIKALKDELIFIEVDKKIESLADEIKDWENKINGITGGEPHITIENNVDLTGPPTDFEFINDSLAGEGVQIPTDPPVGCECSKGSNCYDERDKCCAMQFGYKFAYTKYRKVNLLQGSPIYECNSRCKCGPECANRVVQDGKSDHKLCIFRTSNGRGWGVKTLKSIKKGSFVTLYVGEVIKSEEADRRGELYDEVGCTYLFDLDFNDSDDCPYSIDASKCGNVAHFINHSCMPNLGVYAVWTDCLDPNLPKLAMFALKDINKNEELTFDYNLQLNSDANRTRSGSDEEKDDRPVTKKTVCLCGTERCRKYIF